MCKREQPWWGDDTEICSSCNPRVPKCCGRKPNIEQKNFGAEEEEAALSSSFPLPPLTCYANRLSSCPLAAHCTVASADLLSARCPTQARDTVHWKRFCLYLVPLSFRRLKAWPSMLPHPPLSATPHPLPRCPVPRGPPLFSGLARVEQRQSGAREQTRVSLTASLQCGQGTDCHSASPSLSCLPQSGVHHQYI